MLTYAIKRTILAVAVALFVSSLVFLLTNAAADPASVLAGEGARDEDIRMIRAQYGFDRPLPEQYLSWVGRLVQGDLGQSYRMKRPTVDLLAERLPITLSLGLSALGFAVALGIPLGVLAALRPNSWIDRLALAVSVVGQAMPTFWFSLLLILLFGVTLRWLPISGAGRWTHLVMPSVALGYYATPAIMRLTRAGMIDALASDYIRTARAKGLLPFSILFKHALRNALVPVVSLAAVQFGFMLGGSVVIEAVFALPGLGFLAWESITRSDIPVVQAIVLMVSLVYVLLTLLADLLNAWLDPRLRLPRGVS